MSKRFYEESSDIREEIRNRIRERLSNLGNHKIKNVVMQRNSYSSLVKGVMVYYLHEGLKGPLTHKEKIDLASGIEIFCSSGVILDNVVDEHDKRNEHTTYLKEYGPEIQLAASQYALHFGLKLIFSFLHNFCISHSERYQIDEAVLGMIKTDIEQSKNLHEQITAMELSNGLFNKVPLVMAATAATNDKFKITEIGEYGFNLGVGLGIYEEVRDLLGEHGRKKATEIKDGRFIIPLHFAVRANKQFDPLSYLGKELSGREYSNLIRILVNTKSLDSTADLANTYFEKAIACLKNAVEADCVDKLKPLSDSAKVSMQEFILKVRNAYAR